jgi:hypothetical protein
MRRKTVERAMEEDHDAFSELARASMDRLYAVATLILRDSERARDAVQESLIAAWRDIRALRDPDKWEAWLHVLRGEGGYEGLTAYVTYDFMTDTGGPDIRGVILPEPPTDFPDPPTPAAHD